MRYASAQPRALTTALYATRVRLRRKPTGYPWSLANGWGDMSVCLAQDAAVCDEAKSWADYDTVSATQAGLTSAWRPDIMLVGSA